jgi:hypothetical protein
MWRYGASIGHSLRLKGAIPRCHRYTYGSSVHRSYAFRKSCPATLHATIRYLHPHEVPKTAAGFDLLPKLYDPASIHMWIGARTNAQSAFTEQSQALLSGYIPSDMHCTEIQKTSLLISRVWLQTMVWAYSRGQETAIQSPYNITEDLLHVLNCCHPSALKAHGISLVSSDIHYTGVPSSSHSRSSIGLTILLGA